MDPNMPQEQLQVEPMDPNMSKEQLQETLYLANNICKIQSLAMGVFNWWKVCEKVL
jgi:hypothetical protein